MKMFSETQKEEQGANRSPQISLENLFLKSNIMGQSRYYSNVKMNLQRAIKMGKRTNDYLP